MQGVGCPDGVGPRGYLSAGAGESNPHGGTRRLAHTSETFIATFMLVLMKPLLCMSGLLEALNKQ